MNHAETILEIVGGPFLRLKNVAAKLSDPFSVPCRLANA
jgi:hypothetical protein